MLIKNKKINLITLGCRTNLFESDAIEQELINHGGQIEQNLKKANIAIINTCSVTHKADAKSNYFINKASKQKNIKLIIVIGCYSQVNKIENKKVKIILGTQYKNQLINIIKSFKNKKIIKIEKNNKNFESFNFINNKHHTRALLKIQDGCNHACSYCIVPSIRGKQKSMDSNEVIKKIIEMAKNHKEIVLTGINLASYKSNGIDFINLLQKINDLPIQCRIRISSIEPFQVNKDMIDLITSNKHRWCQTLHICIQSANNEVVKMMNRNYLIEDFINLCHYIRSKNPLFSITTDYIVGYPTETEEQFKNALINLDKICFSDMHIFPFSQRKGTKAEQIKNIVSLKQMCERLKIIQTKAKEHKIKYLQQFINKKVNVVFEKGLKEKYQYGHSEYFFKVYVQNKNNLFSQKKEVLIKQLIGDQLFGSIS